MAVIRHHRKVGLTFEVEEYEYSTPLQYCVDNFEAGITPFTVMSGDNDITHDLEAMQNTNGVYCIFEVPGSADVLFVAIVAVFIDALIPNIEIPDNVNRNEESPNNALGQTNNKSRINQRLPTICGKVKSIPDVIMKSYRQFRNDIEEEIGYFCVSDDDNLIEDIKDGDTLIENISSSSYAVYGPNKSPNNSSPDILVGDAIGDLISTITESEEVSNSALKAANELTLTCTRDATVNRAGEIKDANLSFSEKFNGATVIKVDSLRPAHTNIILDGTFDVILVSDNQIHLDVSGSAVWQTLQTIDRDVDPDHTGILEDPTDIDSGFTDWFSITNICVNEFFVNVVAQNGIYKDDGRNRTRAEVEYLIQWQLLGSMFEPVGLINEITESIEGSTSDLIGITTLVDISTRSNVRVRMKRITDKDFDFEGTVNDEIRWRDFYGRQDIDVDNFGICTTIHTRRRRTSLSPAIRNPELSCIATEKVNKYESGVFAATKTPNTQAMQSLIRLSLDERIGKRSEGELNLDNLIAVQSDIENYFGDEDAGKFNYTFDSSKITTETTISNIANSVFCLPFRVGRVLDVLFEKPQTVISQVFTHRSKVANSEKWTRTTLNESTKDGIELKYTDDQNNTIETYFYPEDRSAINPKKLEIAGLRGLKIAKWRAWREYNKLIYNRQSVDITTTEEGRFVTPHKLISIVKGSRILSSDGYIVSIDGLIATLSQDVTFTLDDNHSLIVKNRDGSTVAINVTEGESPNKVVMQTLPTEPIYTGNDELKTEFSFGNDARHLAQRIIPITVDPNDDGTVNITGINYDDRYYELDGNAVEQSPFDAGFNEGFG